MGTLAPLNAQAKTATAVAGAATLNSVAGVVTTETLSTAQGADYTLTLTNAEAAAGQAVVFSIDNGTNSAGSPVALRATPSAGQIVFVVRNLHGSAVALNGTLKISYAILA